MPFYLQFAESYQDNAVLVVAVVQNAEENIATLFLHSLKIIIAKG
jgi:hypothetical protein